MAAAIKNRLSGAVKSKIKGRAKAKYAGQKGAGSVFARAKAAAKAGTKLGGKKTGWAATGKGVVTNKQRAKGALDLSKKFAGKSPAALAKAQKARTLARQAARTRHAAAVKRGRKAATL